VFNPETQMSESLHIVCPHCNATNRIPEARPRESTKCAKCYVLLFSGQPLEVGSAAFDRHIARDEIPLMGGYLGALVWPL